MLAVMIMPLTSRAQVDFSDITGRAIFPIVNKYEGNTEVEFIAAEADDGNRFNPTHPHYYRAERMWHFKGTSADIIQTEDFGGGVFLSFNYISQTKGNGVTWNSGASTQQFVFHPGNHYNEKDLLYAFIWKHYDGDPYTGDLYLVDVSNKKTIAQLTSDFKGREHASINVFSQLNNDVSDMLVITNNQTFLVYNELPSETSGINSITLDDNKQNIYNISGVKVDKPQTGVNIINGKKYVKK